MDYFGYEMAADAASGAGLPNIRGYTSSRRDEWPPRVERPDERYELRLVRQRYIRRGNVFGGAAFNGEEFRRVLDEMEHAVVGEEVETPLFVWPKTVKRSRKQMNPRRLE